MTSNRVVTALLLITALVAVAAPAAAQYMYLDSNGNGVHDSGDRLAPNGAATTVDVWLVTNENRDGSAATCAIDPTAPMALNDYYVNFKAAGGLVTYSGFVTHFGNAPIGEFNPADGVRYGNGLVGIFTTLPPGTHRIASLTITGTSGTPQVGIVDLHSGQPQYTMFSAGAAGCFGNDFDNVLKLAGPGGGTDWTDVDGLGPANQPPVLAAISNKTIMAGNTLTFTATATDPDVPAQTLTFSLDPGAPAGATITAGGIFSWPVPVNQIAPVSITVRVTDSGTPALSDAKSFTVFVLIHETGPPVITNPGNKTVNEGECLNFLITATSPEGGALTFSLGAGAPAGASITAGGQFIWCPTEAQGPGVYAITVNCSDGFQVGSATFSVLVLEVNLAPVLAPIGNIMTCGPGTPVTFTATSTDPDLPANTRTFSIDPGAPPGATIGAVSGVFSWTPFDGGVFPFTIRVTDNGSPPLSDTETIAIFVPLSPSIPVLQNPGDMTVMAGLTADHALHATDRCGNAITFSKFSGPAFVTVTTLDPTTGNLHLAPTAADVGSHSVTVLASTAFGSDAAAFTVTVTPNNALPVLQPIANMTVDEGAVGTQTIFASDPDNAPITFSKISGPFWVLVETTSATTGLVTATPDFSSGGSTYPVTVRASNGPLFDQRSFTITVNETCQTPAAVAGGPYTGQLSQPVEFDGTGSSDASGTLTSYTWDFGDGSTGSGAIASHTYVALGTYTVVLTVGNGCGVTDSDVTSATIFECNSTNAFLLGGYKQINLQSGKPTWCTQIEAIGYDVNDIDLSSIVLRSAGTGSVGEIHALSDKTSVGGDRNGNGLSEVSACFRKEDLRQLFSNVTGTQQLQVTLAGNLSTGGSICAATLTVTVKGGGGAIAASITPNPLNPSAVLTFATQARGPVLVQLFDVHGRLLRTLRDENDAAAGYHDVRIDGIDGSGARLSSGVYYVRIRAGAEEERKAITILK